MPLEVLGEVQRELVKDKDTGMSIMEMSHRSKEFMQVANEAEKNLRDVLGVPDSYKVIFTQGGATLQFSSIPLNLLGGAKTKADYFITGQWSDKAHNDCARYGTPQAVCNMKPSKFTTIPGKEKGSLTLRPPTPTCTIV